MPWVPLDLNSKYAKRQLEGTEGTTGFIIDNNVDEEKVFNYLDGRGLSAWNLDYEARSRPDTEVLAEAWALERVLLTHMAHSTHPF